MNDETKQLSEIDNAEGKVYFDTEFKEVSNTKYFFIALSMSIFMYIFFLDWNLQADYDNIKSLKNYPMLEIKREQLSYVGQDFQGFKKNSEVKDYLSGSGLEKYWLQCVGRCSVPDSSRFKDISHDQKFINWVCRERIKDFNFTGLQYTDWRLDNDGCVLTNLEDVKEKDTREINSLKRTKREEIFKNVFLLIIDLLFNFFLISKFLGDKNDRY